MAGMVERFLDRLARAAHEVERAGLDALLVTPSADLLYLTGYDPPTLPRLTCLVVRPGRDPVLLVPELEGARARHAPVGRSLEIVPWRDGDDPYDSACRLLPPAGMFAVSDRTWAVHVLGLERRLPDATFVAASPVLSALRATKDHDELELLARAARATDEAFRRIVETRLEGLREREVAARLSDLLLEAGLERVNFTIVASGPNGASPHHQPGDRAIRAGDPLVLDFGGRVGGYCSDLTRTVAVGSLPPDLDEVHEVVREAQERAFRAVRPGIPAEDVDRAAREVIEEAGYGERFIHRTGHGIGLEVHEPPFIVRGNRDPLRPGMCFSIEPGIYLDGRFGVRIEDIVAVSEGGAARLNHAPRELLTVG